MNEIECIEAGYRKVIQAIQNPERQLLQTDALNNGRYLLGKTSKGNILVMFKRDFFHNFGRMLRDQGASGMGETINVEDLKTAIQKEVKDLFFIYPSGAVYSVSLEDFLNNSFKWTNKENKEVRSISIHLLRRIA